MHILYLCGLHGRQEVNFNVSHIAFCCVDIVQMVLHSKTCALQVFCLMTSRRKSLFISLCRAMWRAKGPISANVMHGFGLMYSQRLTRKSETCAVSTIGICNEIFMLEHVLWESCPKLFKSKAFSAGRFDLDQTQVGEVGAGIKTWVCGARLRS